MQDLKYQFTIALFSLSAFLLPMNATEVLVESYKGDKLLLDVQPQDSFIEIIDSLGGYFSPVSSNADTQGEFTYDNNISAFRIELAVDEGRVVAKSAKNPNEPPRDYYNSLTQSDRSDIGYILRTLSTTSIFKILGYKSSLEKAGDRVEHVHPLRFLETIFTDEELKVSIRNLQGKGWVWKDFLEGITTSLSSENAADNLKPEYVKDFGKRVKVDPKLIIPSIKKQEWKKLVEILIDNVPREGDPNRYDM